MHITTIRSTESPMAQELRKLVKDGEALLRSTADLSGEALAEARDRFRTRLSAAKASVDDSSYAIADAGRKAAAATDGFVRAHPWPVIGIATGVGLLVGVAFMRNRT